MYSNSRITKSISTVTVIVGSSAILFAAFAKTTKETKSFAIVTYAHVTGFNASPSTSTDNGKYLNAFLIFGITSSTTGVILDIASLILEGKSIKRFNSLGIATQNLQVGIIPTTESISIGLTWNIGY